MVFSHSFAQRERQLLAEALLARGPASPTLCEGWTTKDLAVHLLVREQHSGAVLQDVLPGKSHAVAEISASVKQRPFADIVQQWREGPKGLNPWRLLDPVANAMEYFIHHEDVRRGSLARGERPTPRHIASTDEQILYRLLRLLAPRSLHSAKPVALFPTGFRRLLIDAGPGVTLSGSDVIRVDGDVGEILLWVCGRDVVDTKFAGEIGIVERMNLQLP